MKVHSHRSMTFVRLFAAASLLSACDGKATQAPTPAPAPAPAPVKVQVAQPVAESPPPVVAKQEAKAAKVSGTLRGTKVGEVHGYGGLALAGAGKGGGGSGSGTIGIGSLGTIGHGGGGGSG